MMLNRLGILLLAVTLLSNACGGADESPATGTDTTETIDATTPADVDEDTTEPTDASVDTADVQSPTDTPQTVDVPIADTTVTNDTQVLDTGAGKDAQVVTDSSGQDGTSDIKA